jgi:uncharacterized protein YcfJ
MLFVKKLMSTAYITTYMRCMYIYRKDNMMIIYNIMHTCTAQECTTGGW